MCLVLVCCYGLTMFFLKGLHSAIPALFEEISAVREMLTRLSVCSCEVGGLSGGF